MNNLRSIVEEDDDNIAEAKGDGIFTTYQSNDSLLSLSRSNSSNEDDNDDNYGDDEEEEEYNNNAEEDDAFNDEFTKKIGLIKTGSQKQRQRQRQPLFDSTKQQEQYTEMINMTLELVRDMTIAKKNDEVITRYGKGILRSRKNENGSMEIDLSWFDGYYDKDADGERDNDNDNKNNEEAAAEEEAGDQFESFLIKNEREKKKREALEKKKLKRKSRGIAKLYHRRPELGVYKNVPPSDYETAMDHLEQVRKLSLTAQSQQWNVPMQENVCVACLFDKPFYEVPDANKNKKNTITAKDTARRPSEVAQRKRRWFSRGLTFTGSPTSLLASSSNDHNKIDSQSFGGSNNNNSSSSFSIMPSSSGSSRYVHSPLDKDGTTGKLKKKKKKTRTLFCDICGNPVCAKHVIPSKYGTRQQMFRMCVDCQADFNLMFQCSYQQQPSASTTSSNDGNNDDNNDDNNNNNKNGGEERQLFNANLLDLDHIPQLHSLLDRLLLYYTRMVLNLTFCIPNLRELAARLTASKRTNMGISLGTGTISFVGAALGVAGAAALLTPAGPALLLAAAATSASSAAIQGGQAGYNALLNISAKEADQLSDRILGWYGLCLGILDALEQLRYTLVKQMIEEKKIEDEKTEAKNNAADGKTAMTVAAKNLSAERKKQKEKEILILQKIMLTTPSNQTNYTEQSLDALNLVAAGTYHTTRHGLTGVSLTASLGASYSQMITASIQAVPVVGAAFSVGCMAMDASHIATTIEMYRTPNEKVVALQKVEQAFPTHVPSTITKEVEAFLRAIDDVRERKEEAQRIIQQDLIEKELEELM